MFSFPLSTLSLPREKNSTVQTDVEYQKGEGIKTESGQKREMEE
jgi:hypothetical protein